MFHKTANKGMVRFELAQSRAKKVSVAGDFNGWKPVEMKKTQNGVYAAIIAARQNVFEYKFVVDGQWIADPDNSNRKQNAFGTENSVAAL